MKKIFIVSSLRDIERTMARLGVSEREKCFYFSYGDESPRWKECLKQFDIERLTVACKTDESRNTFLKEYIDLVGRLSKENARSREWWATDVSSKNRFVSRLSLLLQEFIETVRACEQGEGWNLFLVGPSAAIIPSLRNYFGKTGMVLDEGSKRREVSIKDLMRRSKKILSLGFHAVRLGWRSTVARRRLAEHVQKRALSQKISHVVRSFVYDHSLDKEGSYKDPFFGRFTDFLKGRHGSLVLADVLGDYKTCLVKIGACKTQTIVPWEYFLTFKDIMSAVGRILCCRIEVPEDLDFFGHAIVDIIKGELYRTLNGIAVYQYLQYESVARLLKNISPDVFFLTYENNPWEKMCIKGIREHSAGTQIVGYQHAVIPQAAANMFMSRHEIDGMPRPDRILTTGLEPKRIMEENGCLEEGIEPACALRYEYLSQTLAHERTRCGTVLLALEGIFDVHKMVNYVMEELKENKEFRIVIRTHPVLPVKLFRHKLKYDIGDLDHFELSKEISVKKDIERSDIVVYWGTTVALEALSLGKPVVHYDNGAFLSYDPLYKCNDLKWVVSDGEPLLRTLRAIRDLSDQEYLVQRDRARDYLKQYFYPVHDEALEHFLSENHAAAAV